MNERVTRMWAGAEAAAIGCGGLALVARATGMSRTTLRAGKREVAGESRGELHRQNGGVTSFTWLNELMTNIASTKPGTALGRAVEFDGLGQPTKWDFTHQSTGPSALHVDVRRDNMGRIASSTMAMAGGATSWRGYVYDAMGRLSVVRESRFTPGELPEAHQPTGVMGEQVEASADAESAQRWAYEREAKVGSVVTISRTDVTLTAPRFSASARAAGHQLQSYNVDGSGQRAVTHDGAGRLTNDGTQRFVFDDMGALVETRELGTDAVKEAYLYDVSGRLVSRGDASGDGELLVYDGIHMVQAWNPKENLSWAASWGPGVDRLLSVEKQGTEYFALDDGKGSVVGWLDSGSNTLAARAEYTPEGRGKYVNEAAGTSCTDSGNTRCRNHLGLPFGFHSAFAAKETGLLYFRNRWYSPEANQWLSQDPLDFVDSFNLYAFNGFDAVNHRDPMGLSVGAVTCGAGAAGCEFDSEEVEGERAEPGAAAPEPARPEFEFSFTEMEYQLDVANEYAVGPAMDRYNDKPSSRDVSSGGGGVSGQVASMVTAASPKPSAAAPKRILVIFTNPGSVEGAFGPKGKQQEWRMTAHNKQSYGKAAAQALTPGKGAKDEVVVRPLTTADEGEALQKELPKLGHFDAVKIAGHQGGGDVFNTTTSDRLDAQPPKWEVAADEAGDERALGLS